MYVDICCPFTYHLTDCMYIQLRGVELRVPAGALGLLGLSGALELLPQRSNGAL